jgi:hypothetical protein
MYICRTIIIESSVCLPLPKIYPPQSHKTYVTLRTSCCPSSRFLSILWKSKNFNCGQVSLNLTHCIASQTDFEPRHPGPDSTLQPFGFSSAACYTTVIPLNWPSAAWDATDTQLLSEKWPRDATTRSKPRSDHSPPSSVKVNNEQNYTSTSPYAFMVCTRTSSLLLLDNSYTRSKLFYYIHNSFYHFEDLTFI